MYKYAFYCHLLSLFVCMLFSIAAKENNLYFGVCPVGNPCNLTFTLTNYSPDPIRYQWPAVPCLTFAPSLGHLRSGASCDITTTFTNIKPKEYKQQRLAGKYWKISYTESINQVWLDLHCYIAIITFYFLNKRYLNGTIQ